MNKVGQKTQTRVIQSSTGGCRKFGVSEEHSSDPALARGGECVGDVEQHCASAVAVEQHCASSVAVEQHGASAVAAEQHGAAVVAAEQHGAAAAGVAAEQHGAAAAAVAVHLILRYRG